MPDFRKSYKKSKNSKNSKSGGRRRKHTMRKYRRGKKVMRGGAIDPATLESIKTYLSSSGESVLVELGMKPGDIYNDNFETIFTTNYDNLSSAAKLKLKTFASYPPSV